jgi:hypothetical protein
MKVAFLCKDEIVEEYSKVVIPRAIADLKDKPML